jgi:hypothetical protein
MNFELLENTIPNTHNHFQQQASKAINISLTLRNWLFGFYMVDFEQKGKDRAKYGDKIFDELSSRLKIIKSIDRRALYRFKDFYLLYPQIAFYIGTNQLSFSQQIVGSSTPLSEMLPIVGSLTPQSQNKMQVPAEKLLNYLSYTPIKQLLQIKDLKTHILRNRMYKGHLECARAQTPNQ